MTDNAIVTENLTKVYGKLTAVDHVTLNVASGTVFGLLGPNGAGKTTMIKLLTGLTDMTEGDASVADSTSVGIRCMSSNGLGGSHPRSSSMTTSRRGRTSGCKRSCKA